MSIFRAPTLAKITFPLSRMWLDWLERLYLWTTDTDTDIATINTFLAPITAIYTGKATIDFGVITTHATATSTITVTGAAVDAVTPQGVLIANVVVTGGLIDGYVSGANTVTIRCVNLTAADINPTSKVYTAIVFDYA